MLERNALAVGLVLLSFSQLTTIAADFRHELKGDAKPWTNEAFPDDHQEFHFAIVSDRTGGERKGFFEKGIDSINLLRPEFVMSVGDETASAAAADFVDAQVFDFGFKGDRIENVLCRVRQGELKGYDPQLVVISVGGHNRGANTTDEIAAANRKLVSMVRAVVPAAEVRVLGETR